MTWVGQATRRTKRSSAISTTARSQAPDEIFLDRCHVGFEAEARGVGDGHVAVLLLERIAQSGQASFLSVLKKFGNVPGPGRFSFPMEGYTLALDFPVNKEVLKLMDQLDRITVDHGGRFYLAKDARLSAETFQATEERFSDFAGMRDSSGAAEAFASMQSRRLGL